MVLAVFCIHCKKKLPLKPPSSKWKCYEMNMWVNHIDEMMRMRRQERIHGRNGWMLPWNTDELRACSAVIWYSFYSTKFLCFCKHYLLRKWLDWFSYKNRIVSLELTTENKNFELIYLPYSRLQEYNNMRDILFAIQHDFIDSKLFVSPLS